MTEPNLPDRYLSGSGFYEREEDDTSPVIRGRRIKRIGQCKVCSLIPRLMSENNYTFEEARDAEHDLYRYIYTMWGAEEISHWLYRTHEFSISHDAVSNHIKKHIPDPNIAMMERVKSYRPDIMNKKFFRTVSDTMKTSIFKFQEDVLTGQVKLDPPTFLKMVEALRDWQDILGEDQVEAENHVALIMEAMDETMMEVLADQPETRDRMINTLREKLVEREERDG